MFLTRFSLLQAKSRTRIANHSRTFGFQLEKSSRFGIGIAKSTHFRTSNSRVGTQPYCGNDGQSQKQVSIFITFHHKSEKYKFGEGFDAVGSLQHFAGIDP